MTKTNKRYPTASLTGLWTACILISSFSGYAQMIKQTFPEILSAYNKAKPDSQKVRLLLALDTIYLYQSPDTREVLDSALLMAQEAQKLSSKIGYQSGYDDATFMLANSFAEKMDMVSAAGIANSVTGVLHIRLLIMIGERYLFRPGELKPNIDSAQPYIKAALKTSEAYKNKHWLYQSLSLMGKYYFALGNIDSGRICFQKMIAESRSNGQESDEAHWHGELGRYMPHTDKTYEESVSELSQSEQIYEKLDDKRWEIEILEVLAYLHKLKPAYSSQAEFELKKAIRLRNSIQSKKTFLDYVELSEMNQVKGNLNTALLYSDSAVRQMESSKSESYSGGIVYSQIAKVYKAIGENKNSIQFFEKALAHLVDYRTEYLFPIASQIISGLLDLDSAKQALSFLKHFIRQNPPERIVDKEIVASCFGNCYAALNKQDAAETFYLQMIELDKEAQAHMGKQSVGERSNLITGSEAYYEVGRFYIDGNQFAKAKPYIEQSINFQRFGPSVERQIDLHQLMFRIDSAQGNTLSAIQHLKLKQELRDSVFSDRKAKQIAELQIQYAIEKKEKDLEIIRAKEKINDQALDSYARIRTVTSMLIFLLLVLIIVGYGRYSQKQKSNKELQKKQEEIDHKNGKLQELITDKDALIADKDRLLDEKEILVKEIHHRVKNNLQIVISLLNTQSKYLNNKEAIHAITDSRCRMQAMSLIHEKLYQSESTSSVNLQLYIAELAYYLKDSYSFGSQIDFNVQVEPIELNLAQAIPLGLMINEVITNAIKYAFPGKENGCIGINMTVNQDNMVHLTIQDDGIGLPDEVDIQSGKTMGMRLVNGLVKQLNASIIVEGKSGVKVSVRFKAEKTITSSAAHTDQLIVSDPVCCTESQRESSI